MQLILFPSITQHNIKLRVAQYATEFDLYHVTDSNFSQMFSFVKALDMYHETISFTFYGDNKEIKNYLLKNYFDRAIFIYNTENKSDSGVVICKNQTCSNKISSINEINDYLKDISN